VTALALPAAGPLSDRPAELLLLLGALALLPFALVTLTSFLKFAVVLSIARSALGAPQVPPSSAVTGLALLLTLVSMAPVGEAALEAWRRGPEPRGATATLAAASRSVEPLRSFLARHARADDRLTFLDLARRARPAGPLPAEGDLAVLAPAFVVSELRRAFTIGFSSSFLPGRGPPVRQRPPGARTDAALPHERGAPLQAPALRRRRRLAPPGPRPRPRLTPLRPAVEAALVAVAREALWLALLVSAPPLLAAFLVGLVVGVLQAATQVQEPAVAVAPRVAAVLAAVALSGPLVAARVARFALAAFDLALGATP
jgi:type III secretion protein R